MKPRVLLVLSAHRRLDASTGAGPAPRRDYAQLQQVLDADVIDYASVETSWWLRLLRRTVGAAVLQAMLAFVRRRNYDAIYTDGEHLAIPLALMLRTLSRRPAHISIGHLLDTPIKRLVFRYLRPQAGLDRVFVHSARQQEAATRSLGFQPAIVSLLPYQADSEFWRSAGPASAEPLIGAAGLEYRDYATLIAAVDGLDAQLTIAAGSYWSKHHDRTRGLALPANARVASGLLDYAVLRSLYEEARVVVVPLLPVANQAGITTILEAMAMGRPVVVTATAGQRDVVCGRLCTASGPVGKPWGGPSTFGVAASLAHAETGLYVPPGDPDALRAAIQYLLGRPDEAARMGAAGRKLVQEVMNVDAFAARIAAGIREAVSQRSGGVIDHGGRDLDSGTMRREKSHA
jgi:glycosyltransferase involved in cell wall biosynthesis